MVFDVLSIFRLRNSRLRAHGSVGRETAQVRMQCSLSSVLPVQRFRVAERAIGRTSFWPR